ncbi:MAG: glycosyltransferase family 4 protein [Desulfobacterales bacterium]
MKILMIHPHDIYHDLEPWTVRITYLAQELIESGHEVKLVYHLFESDTEVSTAIKRQDYPFETIPFHRIGPGLGRRCFEIENLASWADIIHFQKCTHYVSIPAIFSAFFHGRPVHYDWDDWEQKIYEQSEFNRLGSWIFFQQMEKHLLKLVDTISVSSNGLRQLTVQYGFPQERVFYVPVGADLETFSPSVDGTAIRQRHDLKKYLVLYHGQISGANYLHLFLHAAQIILSFRRDVSFAVAGGGDRLDDAKKLADKLGIAGDLSFTDNIPHTEVPEYIAAADVTVACFEDNAQARCKSPLKLIEYMASGKAIVASQMGEVPNMLGDCGLLVEPESPDAIAKGVDKLLNDPGLRKHMGHKARKRAEHTFNWKKSARTLIEAYQNALCVRYGLN